MESGIKRAQLRIGGMSCVACQNRIEKKLRGAAGVQSANVSYNTGVAEVAYDAAVISMQQITAIIEQLGYQILDGNGKTSTAGRTAAFLGVIAALFLILQHFGVLNLLAPGQLADSKMGYGMLFVIGLITSVHCIAMCGGINLSQSLPKKDSSAETQSRFAAFLPALLYNLGRVISYTAIGAVLGLVGWLAGGGGQNVGVPLLLQGILKLLAGVFMVIMGVNMLGIFPSLRKWQVKMPKVFTKKLNTSTSKSPLIVGLLNGLMPCGPLQSMQIVALASGNPLAGALAMFLFSLGTVPLMLGLGSLVAALGKKFAQRVMAVGAVLVVVLGLAMLTQGWRLTGFQLPHFTQQTASEPAAASVEIIDGTQIVRSELAPNRYPNITVQAGVPVKWIITAPQGSINGCNNRMLLSAYGVTHTFQPGENVIEFTPGAAGVTRYSCWMGMIQGTITVTTADGSVPATQAEGEGEGAEDYQPVGNCCG
ncbi:MAG: sulfite exporter TauE/SafE family protein [Oscillospiraceae bacterium]|jgi:sulfite exporter TauE/SafE/copper chaperone CopZ|nr:sulfite exporter TauE/SafE family protein [Oscillospiraceae bacterium]